MLRCASVETTLGFVHQVLTHVRRHPGSATSTESIIGTNVVSWLGVMTTYGSFYLSREEYDQRLSWWLRRYGVYLAKAILRGKAENPQFRELHRRTLSMLRESVTVSEIARGLALSVRR